MKISEGFKDYHKNLFQIICNSYILKHKYLLYFDLNEDRINQLVENQYEKFNFNKKLQRILMKTYNLKEEEILVTHLENNINKYIAVLVFKSNYNKDIEKDELIKLFEKDEELKTFSDIEKELIIPEVKLSLSMLNPREYNENINWGKPEKRGGEDYIPPLGWMNYPINISHAFNEKNSDWLRKLSKNEWAIGYCGITGISKKMEQIYENDDDIKHPGTKIGTGVYCFSDPKIFEENTETINANGNNYKIGFMIRVKPDKIRVSEKNKSIWIVNGNDNEFRPIGILLKKI